MRVGAECTTNRRMQYCTLSASLSSTAMHQRLHVRGAQGAAGAAAARARALRSCAMGWLGPHVERIQVENSSS
jgi:hypothetical protein